MRKELKKAQEYIEEATKLMGQVSSRDGTPVQVKNRLSGLEKSATILHDKLEEIRMIRI